MNKRIGGFTLVELIITIVVLAIIAVGASSFINASVRAIIAAYYTTDAIAQGRVAMERMAREIRTTRTTNDISTATASQYSFIDIDGSNVNYTISGNTITRNGVVLADGIGSLTFSYLDRNGAVTAVISNIRFVSFNINVIQNNLNFNLTTAVNLRELF